MPSAALTAASTRPKRQPELSRRGLAVRFATGKNKGLGSQWILLRKQGQSVTDDRTPMPDFLAMMVRVLARGRSIGKFSGSMLIPSAAFPKGHTNARQAKRDLQRPDVRVGLPCLWPAGAVALAPDTYHHVAVHRTAAAYGPSALPWLRDLPAVQILR